jgi:hypothetical protein
MNIDKDTILNLLRNNGQCTQDDEKVGTVTR